ncbi:MAG: desulfoferrodoxin FeS4 iron-binding domain-containing protein [Dehalococcoidales bacterium]|nr:desulfoferrodoxin FeS4 iron-binding domain-containing protein [Dehalococcoidales bacterium]
MSVKNTGEIYRCAICGNEVSVLIAGGGTLCCCGQDMQKVTDIQDVEISRRLPDSGM